MYFLKWIDFYGFIIGYILTYSFSLCLLIINLTRNGNLKFVDVSLLDKSTKKGIFWYGGTTFLASVASTFAFRIDALMIGAMVVSASNVNYGLEAVAIYAVALNIASVIEMPFRAISQIASPLISEAWKENDLQKINSIYAKASETMIVIGGYVFMGIWCCIDDVIKILPSDYAGIKYVFLWLGLGKFINVAFGTNGHIIINSAYYKIFTWLSFFGLIFTFLTNYFFIIMYNEVGAALATSITYFVLNLIMFSYLIIKFKFQPFRLNNLMTIGLAIFLAILLSYVDFKNAFLNICVKGIVLSILYWFIILKFKLSEEIHQYITKLGLFSRLRFLQNI
jgi:O-antigen/teichoic acid export membrane protein